MKTIAKSKGLPDKAAKYVTPTDRLAAYNRAVLLKHAKRRPGFTLSDDFVPSMEPGPEVLNVLESVLNLKGRTRSFELSTPLLGSVPELDSMAVVSVITSLEERFGFTVEDDEVDGSTFQTVGSLIGFVEAKLRG